jgi:hypothetical protein
MTAPSLVCDQHAFIAYRSECGHAALALARTLRRSGREVFRDLEGLRSCDIWAETVRAAIEKASAVIVLIDRSWNAAESGRRDLRLWTEKDPLRIELRHAIKHSVPLIPVLVDDAVMPLPAALPRDIRALSKRRALRLRHTELEADAKRLAANIERIADDRDAISAVIETLGAEPASAAAEAMPVVIHTSVEAHSSSTEHDGAIATGSPFERRSVLDRLSAFKPSALREKYSNGKSDDLRSILARLSGTGTPTADHTQLSETEDQPVAPPPKST